MKYGSVCSGIEAATVAWHPLGWEPQFFSEIEPFPCSVLAHHYPHVPNHGDMTKYKEWPDAAIDVLVGGTPCQSFSVAGLRKGLDDPRGNLMLTYLAIADRYRPRWLVWENVPGVLSSNGGRDFGTFLGGLGQLGYGFAYRVLDAQYFGVPQRRRRVFVVGYLGEWRYPAAVLFERHSLQGHTPPSRKPGQGVAKGGEFGPSGGRFTDINPTLDCRAKDGPIRNQLAGAVLCDTGEGMVATGVDVQNMAITGDITGTLQAAGTGRAGSCEMAVAFVQNTRDEVRLMGGDGKISGALAAEPGMKQQTYLAFDWQTGGDMRGLDPKATAQLQRCQVPAVIGPRVRRLMPVECERLQGFPDNYTLVPHRRKLAADGPRYKALGNSMNTDCMEWIGERIQMVEYLLKGEE